VYPFETPKGELPILECALLSKRVHLNFGAKR